MVLQIEMDLPPSLECLNNLDTLLRCPICFDYLNISMMTKCSHNFCSLCIRKFFSYKLQCPVCNIQAAEQDLRNNRLLDDLVVNFKAARQRLSKATFECPPISPKTPISAVKCKTPRGTGQKHNSSVLSHYFHKRPKTSATEETQQNSSVPPAVQQGKIAAVRTHNANEAELLSANAQLAVVVKEEPVDGEEASTQVLMSVKKEDTDQESIGPEAEMAHSSSPTEDRKPVIKVECPVCSVCVSHQFINKHLDMCINSAEKKESLRSSPGTARRPMAKVVYNLLSMQELRRRLKECHLSLKGSRDQLIKRHQEFVHMYNAQCDSLNPKSVEDIAKEVEANEKIRSQLQGKTKPVMVFSKNQTEQEIDEMHSKYRKQHSSDFSRLIAQVQGRLETTRQTRIKQEVTVEEEKAPKTHPADPESKSFLVVSLEDEEADEEPSTSFELSPSPTYSDVSISRQMGQQGRKIILFVNNAPSHPNIQLRNINLKLFPLNMTPRLQPMDQGIIQSVKLEYRKRQLRKILQQLQTDKEATGVQIAKRLSILEAIQWVHAAWQETTDSTIQKCFAKAGFLAPSPEADGEPGEATATKEEVEVQTDSSNPRPDMDNLAQELFGCSFQDLATVDENVATCHLEGRDWSLDATALLDELKDKDDVGEESDDEDDDRNDKESSIKNLNVLLDMVREAKLFCAKEGLGDALNAFHVAEEILDSIWSQRQTAAKHSISDIFGPESHRNYEDTERPSVQKRKSSSRGDGAALSPVLGKRRRKT